jgi:uncharacterized membrane protein (UPF0127 family)
MASRRHTLIPALLTLVAALSGCDSTNRPQTAAAPSPPVAESGLPTAPVFIAGERFDIELAYESDAIIKGLGGREEIDPRGGMLFIFPTPGYRQFVMRDCLVPIDIAYLDSQGEVLSTYTMEVEPPRQPDETDWQYNARLERYPSRYRATFVLETAGGTWDRLGVEPGDQIEFDVDSLKQLAR